jgi:hypothetical protein
LRRKFNGFVKSLEHVALKKIAIVYGDFALRREFNGFALSLEHVTLKNYCDSLWRFHLAAEIQWLCKES